MATRKPTGGAFGKVRRVGPEQCGYWHTRAGRRLLEVMDKADRLGIEALTRAEFRHLHTGGGCAAEGD